ncbi:zinc finger protein 879 [Hippocampus zosterae]|uniref:zinc finger protein 879 n=1 Tax=Hippocampus zosterae TaxID=109293 RepID=UPI00223DAB89|nr:zinc finger protein 879 [Hippocampus zosterae]XP_051913264.1 zinc finger protein 879 [Hippocampus zosterae]XP_051913266.1 zinc finger protein 879 [Hippocampus zosterae]
MSGPSGSMVFRHTSKMCMHRKEKHNIKLRTKRTSVSETPPTAGKRRRKSAYPCKICGRLFLHHLSLNAHYTATACLSAIKKGQGTGTDTKTTKLREHRPYNKVKGSLAQGKTVRAGPGRPKQEEEEDDVDIEGEFPCPTCTEVFSLQSQLRQHVELHDTSMVRRECSVCTEKMDTFERPASRRQRFYHCVPCQEGFSSLDSFLEHCQEHLQARDEEDG